MEVVLVNDIRNSGNIAQFNIELSDRDLKSAQRIIVSIETQGEKFEYAIDQGERRITVGVHMHLLKAGKNSVNFELQSRVGTLSRIYSVIDNPINPSDLAGSIAAAFRKYNVPLIFFGPCDAAYYPYSDPSLRPWFDQPDAKETIQSWKLAGKVDDHVVTMLKHFVERGYLTFDGLIDAKLIDQINLEIDEAIRDQHRGYVYGTSNRIEHLHFTKPGIRKLFEHPALLEIVSLLFQNPARPCQTLTFVFGSQQDAHQDTIHLTPFPAGYMCGIWIALQDVAEGSGELEVYPGSHREPRVYMKDVGCAKVANGDWREFGEKVVPIWKRFTSQYERQTYVPKKGTVLIWHENLLHGGSARANLNLERRSIVIHAFARDAIVYYDSSGMVGTIAAVGT
jgi:hypothetical protein